MATITKTSTEMPGTPPTPGAASSPMTRREREKENRRNEILSAARVVFSDKGYSKATLEEIAQKAEFGKGTLYNYFEGGKEELLFTVIEQMYDDVHSLITHHFAATSGSVATRIVWRDLIFKILSYYEEHRDTFIILVKEVQKLLVNGDDKGRYFIEQRNRIIEAMEGPLENVIASGQFRPLPARAVANMLLGNIHGCQMHAFLEKGRTKIESDCTAEANAEFLTTMLLDGLLVTSQK